MLQALLNLEFKAEIKTKEVKKKMKVRKKCLYCNKYFIGKTNQKFCSKECLHNSKVLGNPIIKQKIKCYKCGEPAVRFSLGKAYCYEC